jgi:hypothetical protein
MILWEKKREAFLVQKQQLLVDAKVMGQPGA